MTPFVTRMLLEIAIHFQPALHTLRPRISMHLSPLLVTPNSEKERVFLLAVLSTQLLCNCKQFLQKYRQHWDEKIRNDLPSN